MTLGEIFKNGLILQRGKPVRVFGTSDTGAAITFAGTTQTAPAGPFTVEFPAMDAGGPYTLTAVGDGQTCTVPDIYIGEVILFSGQSNIQFRMSEGAIDPEPPVHDDMLRIFVSQRMEPEPLTPADGWVKADPENIGKWSAIAYQTGRALRQRGIPVGVVVCAQGASVIQSWIDERRITGTALDLPVDQRHGDRTCPRYAAWNADGALYHYMLERLFPFSFGKVVWYQGESNTSPAEGAVYDQLLAELISNWRACFRDPALPFVIVQIADYKPAAEPGWKSVQAAQRRAAQSIPHTVLVVSADVCEKDMIHPVTKWKLAARIADQL